MTMPLLLQSGNPSDLRIACEASKISIRNALDKIMNPFRQLSAQQSCLPTRQLARH